MIEAAASWLIEGMEGATVVARLRDHYAKRGECKVTTLNGVLSRVRGRVIERHTPDLAAIEPYEAAAEFLTKPLREQLAIKRACPDWGEASAVLAGLELLPSTMQTFRLTDDERGALEARAKQQVERRNRTLYVIPRGDDVVRTVERMLEQPEMPTVVLALLLATGRRSVEILSPRTKFEPGPTPYTTPCSTAN